MYQEKYEVVGFFNGLRAVSVVEEWKSLGIYREIDYSGLYEVSNKGRVRSLNSGIAKKGRVLKQSLIGSYKQYRSVTLSKAGVIKTIKTSHLVSHVFIGEKPDDRVVDHINNDSQDDRRSNLQYISCRKNLSKDKKNKTSKYTGVSISPNGKRWKAFIWSNHKNRNLGTFDCELEASEAYQKALSEL
jgi:hypothetical protein